MVEKGVYIYGPSQSLWSLVKKLVIGGGGGGGNQKEQNMGLCFVGLINELVPWLKVLVRYFVF